MVKAADMKASLLSAIGSCERNDSPYPWFLLSDCVPDAAVGPLRDLPFPAPELGGVSGTREAHNKSRNYFDVEARSRHDICDALAVAMQDAEVVAAIETTFGTDLSDTNLRIEYGQDTDGFWLEPHTDIGVKNFTMLMYLSDGPGHDKLGTSIYSDRDTHTGETPFAPNTAMVFIPSDDTWHGFEARPIEGVRKSIIINYVTPEWRAREQLAFPDEPVKAS